MDIGSSVTVKDAADRLGVSQSRIRHLCDTGRLKASKFGGVWAIDAESLQDRIDNPPGPGNPNYIKNAKEKMKAAIDVNE